MEDPSETEDPSENDTSSNSWGYTTEEEIEMEYSDDSDSFIQEKINGYRGKKYYTRVDT